MTEKNENWKPPETAFRAQWRDPRRSGGNTVHMGWAWKAPKPFGHERGWENLNHHFVDDAFNLVAPGTAIWVDWRHLTPIQQTAN